MKVNNGVLEVQIDLPSMESMANAELDIYYDSLKLRVEGAYDFSLSFPCECIDSEAKAKFIKKTKVLNISIPCLL